MRGSTLHDPALAEAYRKAFKSIIIYSAQFIGGTALIQGLLGRTAFQFMAKLEDAGMTVPDLTRRVHISGGIVGISLLGSALIMIINAVIKNRNTSALPQIRGPLDEAMCYPAAEEYARAIFSGAILFYACDILNLAGKLDLNWLIAITALTVIPAIIFVKTTIPTVSDQVIRSHQYKDFKKYQPHELDWKKRFLIITSPLSKAAAASILVIWCANREISGQSMQISTLEIGLAGTYVASMLVTAVLSTSYPAPLQINMSIANGLESAALTYATGSNMAHLFWLFLAANGVAWAESAMPDTVRYGLVGSLATIAVGIGVYRASTTLYRFENVYYNAVETISKVVLVKDKIKSGAGYLYDKAVNLFSIFRRADNAEPARATENDQLLTL